MVKLVNRAKMSTATTGTGTITLGSAATGYQSFAAAGVADGDVVRYVIEDGDNWEIGSGTYTATGTTLTRTVSESSNSGAEITLSGNAVVFVSTSQYDVPIVRASDPTIDTNPPNVGVMWVNSNTGSAFICTNNTPEANVWFGVHSNKSEIKPEMDYLVVAGGGGGAGRDTGGGGGAGGLLTGKFLLPAVGTSYQVVVGAGGAGGNDVDSTRHGLMGYSSSLGDISTIGGGGGRGYLSGVDERDGGSGGGGAGITYFEGGLGTAGQGFGGGLGYAAGTPYYGGGGGGGAGEPGRPADDPFRPSDGGNGVETVISGTASYYAGGGGGAGHRSTAPGTLGNGGLGGGGNAISTGGQSGTANTGGGGGASRNTGVSGGSGGSGVVILRTPIAASATTGSPTVTTDGNFTIYKFTGSGSITF